MQFTLKQARNLKGLSRDKVSKEIKVDRSTIENWEKKGKIHPSRIGERKKIYLVEDINALIFENYKK